MGVHSRRVSHVEQYNEDMRKAQEAAQKGRYGLAMMHASKASFGAHRSMLAWESRWDDKRADAWWNRMEFANLCEEEILALESKTVASPLIGIKHKITPVAGGYGQVHDLMCDATIESMCKRIVELEGW